MNNLTWLQNWYKKNCNNHWEHEYGIVIQSLENPGWRISIPLSYTNLEEKEFQKISIDRSEHDWIRCEVSKNLFVGAGGPQNLEELLTIFKMWAMRYEANEEKIFSDETFRWASIKRFNRHRPQMYNK